MATKFLDSCSPPASSRLFQSVDETVLLLDIPRSIEESQVPPGRVPTRRLVSAPATTEPFVVPEPRYGDRSGRSQAGLVADLMTMAALDHALDVIGKEFGGAWCLPRVVSLPLTNGPSCPEPYIPEGSHYVHGFLQETEQEFANIAPTFDLIALDPPWPNRSARRRTNKYDTVKDLDEMRDLLARIPVRNHLALDGIVAVWITNKESVFDYVLSPGGLFSSWGLRLVCEWTWLKITASGEPITPLDSAWRKPWEKLLIAQRIETQVRPELTRPRVIVAVPDVHSRKPCLRNVLADVLGQDYVGLEVFARNLSSGWWSWGNEVLHFQSAEHWIVEGKEAY